MCSISSSCHACFHLLHSALFVPISHVTEQVGRPMEGAGSSPPTDVLYHTYHCMPNLQFLLPPCAYWAASEEPWGKVSFTFIPASDFWEWLTLWSQKPSHYSCFLSSLVSLGLGVLLQRLQSLKTAVFEMLGNDSLLTNHLRKPSGNPGKISISSCDFGGEGNIDCIF